ncbi:LuxR C-terminal-related transcriptional regulator, partial [Curtobacterium sp. HSID17257]|uniref:LuxR C-terminal-related transcriptional regulator n=1 Tax=Curtobacterium sp. HSID17257 TaxID=2419510 RepID=UPI000F95E250
RAAVRALQEHGAVDLATGALLHLASIAWDHNRVAVPGAPMLEAVHALALPDDDPRGILLAAVTEPLVRGDEVVERVLARGPVDPDDPEQAWWSGYALNIAGEFVEARERLEVAVAGLRASGDIRVLPQALLGASMSNFQAGRLERARTLAEEAVVLGRDLGDAGFATAARACVAWFDGIDGTAPDREAITAGSAAGAHVLQSSVMRANLQGATAAAALLDGRARDAREALRPLLDVDGDAYNPNFAVLTTQDYVDAAVATDARDLVELHAARLAGLHETWHGPILVSALGYTETALALAADPGRAVQGLRDRPLPMPYVQARALLHAGDHLRRVGLAPESRPVLHEALALFERLPAPAWARRTREVLRAAGERLPDAPPSRTTVLTPQELRICTLANTGLTNRAIAQQLFLSPRTVGAHLYSAYRKLGIGGRAQLGAVLDPAAEGPGTA